MSTPSWLKALDPTSSTSALGAYVKQGISAIPFVGGIATSTLTQVGASNAQAAAQKRAEQSLLSSFPGTGVLGFPVWLLFAAGAALVAAVLLLKRK